MRAYGTLCGLLMAAAPALAMAVDSAESFPDFGQPRLVEGAFRGSEAVEAAIDRQLTLAASCSDSKYARLCGQGAAMLFAKTMYGRCSPAGCRRLEAPLVVLDGSTDRKGDHETAVRVAIVQETAARLAAEEPGLSLEHHLLSMAVEFQQGETRNQAQMARLLKKRHKHDVKSLERLLGEARETGYNHRLVHKASDAIGWAVSPAHAVLLDQASLRLSNARCAESGTVCGKGTTPVFAEHGVGKDCTVAACLGLSTERVAAGRPAAAAAAGAGAGHAEGDDGAPWAEAMLEQFPSLLLEKDLVGFRKHLTVVAKARKKEEGMTNEMAQSIVVEGHQRNGEFDLCALQFLAEFSERQGFVGSSIAEARLILARHTTSTMLRRASTRLATEAGNALLAIQKKATAQATSIAHKSASIGKLEDSNAQLTESVRFYTAEAADAKEEIALLRATVAGLGKQLAASRNNERSSRDLAVAIQAELDVERQVREDLDSRLESAVTHAKGLAGDLSACEASSAAGERAAKQDRAVAAEQQQRCVEEVATLEIRLGAQGDHQAEVELLLAASEAGVAVLLSNVEEKEQAAAVNAQRLRGALERAAGHSARAGALQQELHKTTEAASRCRARETALVLDIQSFGTRLEAGFVEKVKLLATIEQEREETAIERRRAEISEAASRSKEKTIAEHVSLAASLRMALGRESARTGHAETQAMALKGAVRDAQNQNRVIQGDLDRCSADQDNLTSLAERLSKELSGSCDCLDSMKANDGVGGGGGSGGGDGGDGGRGSQINDGGSDVEARLGHWEDT